MEGAVPYIRAIGLDQFHVRLLREQHQRLLTTPAQEQHVVIPSPLFQRLEAFPIGPCLHLCREDEHAKITRVALAFVTRHLAQAYTSSRRLVIRCEKITVLPAPVGRLTPWRRTPPSSAASIAVSVSH
jgi:hypothetical protein